MTKFSAFIAPLIEWSQQLRTVIKEGLEWIKLFKPFRKDALREGLLLSGHAGKGGRRHSRDRWWRRWFWPIILLLLLLLGWGLYWYLRKKVFSDKDWACLPRKDLADLQLTNDSVIHLQDCPQGRVVTQGTTQLIKTDSGELLYLPEKNGGDGNRREKPTEDAARAWVPENTIRTQEAANYKVALPDGTHVWLNCRSSLKFSWSPDGTMWKVDLSGEALFDVAKNASNPFTVHIEKGNVTIRVLGTRLDVRAYPEDKSIQTTLLSGKIAMDYGQQPSILLPKQQLVFDPESRELRTVKDADTTKVLKWLSGRLSLTHTPIDNVIHELERRYDLKAVGMELLPEMCVSMDFMEPISVDSALNCLQRFSELHFIREGRQLTITR